MQLRLVWLNVIILMAFRTIWSEFHLYLINTCRPFGFVSYATSWYVLCCCSWVFFVTANSHLYSSESLCFQCIIFVHFCFGNRSNVIHRFQSHSSVAHWMTHLSIFICFVTMDLFFCVCVKLYVHITILWYSKSYNQLHLKHYRIYNIYNSTTLLTLGCNYQQFFGPLLLTLTLVPLWLSNHMANKMWDEIACFGMDR